MRRAATEAPSRAARKSSRISIKIEITANPGETFIDRMIGLVEGASRQKTPNEIALNILIAGLTIIFLLATVTLLPFAQYNVAGAGAGSGSAPSITVLIALLVCLIPTTIGGLLSAIGIAGMDRVMQYNVLAMSGKAVEAAGDVDVLLLDKTGTITLGNRQAAEFLPLPGVDIAGTGRRRPAVVAGRRDAGRPLHRRAGQGKIRPARAAFGRRCGVYPVHGADPHVGPEHERHSASARARCRPSPTMSRATAARSPPQLQEIADGISKQGGTPLAVVLNETAAGDHLPQGHRQRRDARAL